MTQQINLNVNELNNLYYALGTLLADGSKETIGFAPRKQYSDLQDKVWESIVKLNKRIEEQCKYDKVFHDSNFKSKFIKHGDY